MTALIVALILTGVVTLMVTRLTPRSRPSLLSMAFVAAVAVVLAAMLVLR